MGLNDAELSLLETLAQLQEDLAWLRAYGASSSFTITDNVIATDSDKRHAPELAAALREACAAVLRGEVRKRIAAVRQQLAALSE